MNVVQSPGLLPDCKQPDIFAARQPSLRVVAAADKMYKNELMCFCRYLLCTFVSSITWALANQIHQNIGYKNPEHFIIFRVS